MIHIPGHSIYHVSRRILTVWAIEIVALSAIDHLLPGMTLSGWEAAVIGVAVIALLNALVRPVLLALTLPFTVLSFGFLTLVLNAMMLLLAATIVPGLDFDHLLTAILAALGLAAINTLVTSLLSLNDEDSVYRNIAKRILGRVAARHTTDRPGLIMIEIDGLSATTLERAMRSGYAPTLAQWLSEGTHTLARWDCGLPSQTSSSQAGILYGENFDIPAFRWYDKERSTMVVSNQPADAMWIEHRVSNGAGLLRNDGISICNMLSGDAPRCVATISTFPSVAREAERSSPLYFTYYLNPYNFTRALVLMFWEVGVEVWQGVRQTLRNIRPRVSRRGMFPFLRAVTTVFQRELSVYVLMSEMFTGISNVYTTFVGYDVVAHHAGPDSDDAMRIVRDIDRRIGTLRRAAQDAPRPYRFVILSDHGQTRSVPFSHRYGTTLEALVKGLIGADDTVRAPSGRGEAWGHLSALLSEAIQQERLAGRAARRLLRSRTRQGVVEVPREQPDDTRGADVVVCASGNLGHIYLAEHAGRASFETIAASNPGLIEGLVSHDGIGFVLVHSAEHGALVMGRDGIRYLDDDRIVGNDPLRFFGANALAHLRRLDSFPHTGDLVVNGRYEPSRQTVVAFEEMVGSHGGLGGPQTEPFIMYPARLDLDTDALVNSTHMFNVLQRWQERIGVL